MLFIHLSLFLSCLVFSQSIYSMENFSKKKSSKKSSNSESPKKSDDLSINILPQKIQFQSTTNIKRTKEDEPYIPQQKLTKVKSLENLPKYTKDTLTKDTNQNTIDPTASKKRSRILSFSKSDSLITSSTQPSTNSPRSAIKSLINPFSSKSPKILETKQPKIITAVRNNNYQYFKKKMEKQSYDINQQNILGMTALHYAVLGVINGEDSEIINLNKKMIVTLCKYPQTDTSIVNNNLSTAAQFVPANAFPDIRRMLFARLSLDMLAWFETFLMLMSAQIRKEQVGNTDINKTAECIERKIKQTQDLQGCEKLPDDALLPDYMTKDFIADIIKDRIKQQPEETKFLISILHPEIEALLLLMSIDDRMIKEARENVKASLKQQKFNLPKYASDTFFVKVIEAYILEAKKNFNPCLDTIRTEEKPGMFIIPTEIKK